MTTIEILNGLIRHHLTNGDSKIVEELIILRNVYCEHIGDPSDPGVATVLSHRYAERVAQRSEAIEIVPDTEGQLAFDSNFDLIIL